MTPPKMPENNEGIADKIIHKLWNEAVIYARAEENQDLTVRPEAIAAQEARQEIKATLDAKDLLHKNQLEAGKLVGEALQKIKCQNGFYPGCIESEKERAKLRPHVITDVIIPCVRCEALEACRKLNLI